MELTKEFVKRCNKPSILRDFLLQAMDQIDAMEEERRWRKFSEEKPADKQWIWVYVENPSKYGTYIELRRWDAGCKFDVEDQELYTKWMPLPKAPEEK